MKTARWLTLRIVSLILLGILLGLSSPVWAEEQTLSLTEIDTLLRTLTQNSRQTWLSSGSIKALHLEYHDSEIGVMESSEEFRFDGRRFYWMIQMDQNVSNSVSGLPDHKRKHRSQSELNRQRLFCWDGQQYARYYQTAAYAVIVENQNTVPIELFGPFSAGIIPWGYGDYTYSVLSSHTKNAVRSIEDNREIIELTLLNDSIEPTIEMIFILDPQKDYAVLSYTMQNQIASCVQTYNDYILIGDQWIPQKIMIERYDKRVEPAVLLSYEDWSFEEIRQPQYTESSFQAPLASGTLVELRSYPNQQSLLFHYSDKTDIDQLRQNKSIFSASSQGTHQNCATAAAWYIAKKYSKEIDMQELESIVNTQNQLTSAYNLRQQLQSSGLYCTTVTASLEDLKQNSHCTALIYLSDSDHYVVLDHVDNNNVWLIDLTSRKFYWKMNVRDFLQSWTNHVVMFIANTPQDLPTDLQTLTIGEEMDILGGVFENYSCTELLQETQRVECQAPLGGFLCHGVYYKYIERYGCQEGDKADTCIGYGMIGYEYSKCVDKPGYIGECIADFKWLSRYIRACM